MKNFVSLLFLFTMFLSVSAVSCDDPPKPPGKGDVTGVTLNTNTLTLGIGATETLRAIVTPDNAYNKTVKWSSDKPEVATVNESTGEVTAISNGVAVITASANNRNTAICNVTVVTLIPIYTGAELAAIATIDGIAKEYVLMNDISVSNWMPIGNSSSSFMGKLNGNGYTITIRSFGDVDSSDGNYLVGLFGSMGRGSEVRDLKVVVNQTIAKNDGYIWFGGITGGLNGGVIDNCVADMNVSLETSDSYNYVGGIAGGVSNEGIIRNCYTMGKIGVSGDIFNMVKYMTAPNFVGGIAGTMGGSSAMIQNCYTTGNISASGNHYSYVGGVVGRVYDNSTIQNCYTMGNISASGSLFNSSAGGVVGHLFSSALALNSIVQNCYATGNISASESGYSDYAAGIVGFISGGSSVRNCVALNNSIITDKIRSGRHRIGQGDESHMFMNNYGSTAIVAAPVGAWVSDASDKDGANCSARPVESWWKDTSVWLIGSGVSAWDFINIWQWDSATRLPKLRNMPN